MTVRRRVGAILFLSWCVFFATGCDSDEVAIYEVKLKMMWSEDRFPKSDFNPYGDKAQWSPVFGQSHNRSYILYHLGEAPRPAVQRLVKTGIIDDLILQGEEEPKVYDQFSAPAVGSGVGETRGLVVVDGAHSLISLISRLTPTPSWFVGVDSLDLCIDSSWVDQITLDLELLSGGTDKDSFRNDDSASSVTKVGPRTHHLAGFVYKTSREIPTIAKAEFTKKEVYSSEEINKLVRNDVITKLKQKDQRKGLPKQRIDDLDEKEYQQASFPKRKTYIEDEKNSNDQTTKNYVEHFKELEEEPFGTPAPNQPDNGVIIVTKAPTFRSESEEDEDNEWMTMDDAVLAVAKGRKLGLNKHLPRHFKSRLHHAVNRPRRNYDAIF